MKVAEHVLQIIDIGNDPNLPENSVLVSLFLVDMIPLI